MRCIKFDREEKYIGDFIALSRKIYHKKEDMQNDAELRDLLLNRHILSRYFKLHKFCIYKKEEIVGRFILSEYKDDESIYIGFFECERDGKTARFLFDQAESFARKKGFRRIIGPVDASFWIRYRLKTNFFGKRPYTGEPYNPEYYPDLFLKNAYKIKETYTSTMYRPVSESFREEKYIRRKKEFEKRGYRIISPSKKNWERIVFEIYGLISVLYQNFPVYKPIEYKDFASYFSSFKSIINMKMVKIAYDKDRAVGFYISLPNYHNLVCDTHQPLNIVRILKRRAFPKEYIMLYMGVLPEHAGLGGVLVQSIIEELKKNRLPSIGALQRNGNITQFYARELILGRYEYALFEKEIRKEAGSR
ncbi:MAG: hypothetical protein Q4A19_03400 [Johnsonella sp.]|nr:hypothetical protein [Johnsonella sp.]